MTIPQLRAMPAGDRSRKINLIEHWFRLPSAIHHRPLTFEELEIILNWKNLDEDKLKDYIKNIYSQYSFDLKKPNYENIINTIKSKIKTNCKTLFVSATPGEYEIKISEKIVEQIIRPTGLLDPITYVYPKSGDYEILLKSLEKLLKKHPELEKFLVGYEEEVNLKDIFL
jgi:excinuclease ABC subunit B